MIATTIDLLSTIQRVKMPNALYASSISGATDSGRYSQQYPHYGSIYFLDVHHPSYSISAGLDGEYMYFLPLSSMNCMPSSDRMYKENPIYNQSRLYRNRVFSSKPTYYNLSCDGKFLLGMNNNNSTTMSGTGIFYLLDTFYNTINTLYNYGAFFSMQVQRKDQINNTYTNNDLVPPIIWALKNMKIVLPGGQAYGDASWHVDLESISMLNTNVFSNLNKTLLGESNPKPLRSMNTRDFYISILDSTPPLGPSDVLLTKFSASLNINWKRSSTVATSCDNYNHMYNRGYSYPYFAMPYHQFISVEDFTGEIEVEYCLPQSAQVNAFYGSNLFGNAYKVGKNISISSYTYGTLMNLSRNVVWDAVSEISLKPNDIILVNMKGNIVGKTDGSTNAMDFFRNTTYNEETGVYNE